MSASEHAGQPGDRPLSLDELAARPDLPATADVPQQVSAALAQPRLHIAGMTGEASPAELLSAVEETDGEYELRLPAGAFLGRPGRSAERLERAEQDLPAEDYSSPFRPDWATQSLQPRQASQFALRPPMRRINGRQIEPYYGVYGPDDRQVYYPSDYPWRCVGRVFTWTNFAGGGSWNWWGSGVLVGPRHVMTAGHVCPWGSGSWAMLFVPAYWDGSSLHGDGARSYVSDFRGWNTDNHVAAHDMAVLRLYEPVGSWLGWMGTKVYDPGWQGGAYWTLTGYPAMVAGAERPSYQSSIPVLHHDDDGDARELEHQGDATGGDSGGPFFAVWDDGPHTIGATSGGEIEAGGEDNNVEAGGKALVDLAQWALNNWP
jgi:V8-like Glu-specific endopeptidase